MKFVLLINVKMPTTVSLNLFLCTYCIILQSLNSIETGVQYNTNGIKKKVIRLKFICIPFSITITLKQQVIWTLSNKTFICYSKIYNQKVE